MLNSVVERELHQHLEALPPYQQRQVLDFARALVMTRTRGVPGQSLLSFAGTINPLDLAVMSLAAEEDCERIDPQEW